ncbi:MAG: glutamyl-tRNA reductase [Thermanaeromonas sp.]|uniref:glutamyl-tRNA reductase n=1 Tax=Thermanaeromonas sp. TaxID=2003697 RepID=UPI00243E985A|nr:glutamyl-tRNA reductase [Thermanaeromonas sp.]MCG0277855.1 glutamyl-tRNA reductase [Thermanaeromonas sp.]
MFIWVVGLNHRTAPVEIREKLAFPRYVLPEALKSLKELPDIAGAVILSTCNRTEVYFVTSEPEQAIRETKDFLSRRCEEELSLLDKYLYTYSSYEAVRHLFRVASGLDSMILGEAQVLGQVAEAYDIARANDATHPVLNTLFQQAISTGKRVRTETRINHNTVSVSYAAVELARQVFGSLEGRTVLVIGAGKMSTLAARYLRDNGVTTVLVSNRSYERAKALAQTIGGQAVRLDNLEDILPQADIVISCTAASHYILHPEQVARARKGRENTPLMLIDIAVPRDIDPAVGDLPGVKLFDIDDLQQVVLNNLEERQKAAQKAEGIIAEEVENFFQWLGSLSVVPTIVALKKKAEAIKEAELRRAFNRLGSPSPREKKIIGTLANSIVNQLLHDVVVNLKQAVFKPQGHLYVEALQELFGLEVKEEQDTGDLRCRADGR